MISSGYAPPGIEGNPALKVEGRALPLEIRQDLVGRFAPIKNALKEAQLTGFFSHRRCAAKGKANTSGVQIISGFSKFTQQAFSGFGSEAVRNPHQGSTFLHALLSGHPRWRLPDRGKPFASRQLQPGAGNSTPLPHEHIPPKLQQRLSFAQSLQQNERWVIPAAHF